MPLGEHIKKIHTLRSNMPAFDELSSDQLQRLRLWYEKEYSGMPEVFDVLCKAVKYKTTINTHLLHALHQMISKDTQGNTFCSDQKRQGVQKMWSVYNKVFDARGDLTKIAHFSYAFFQIEPYESHNDGVLQLISDIMLLRCGYAPLMISSTQKQDYLSNVRSLTALSDFYPFFLGVQCESMNAYLQNIIA